MGKKCPKYGVNRVVLKVIKDMLRFMESLISGPWMEV